MSLSNPFATAVAREVESVSRNWWLLVLNGLLSIVAGGIVLATDWTVADLAVFTGAVLVFRGFLTAFTLPLDGSSRGWMVFLGLTEVAVGTAVWAWPGPSLFVLALWIGWYVMFRGIMTIAGSISARDFMPNWGLLLAFGILETVLAIYLIGQPGLTLLATIFAIGFWTIAYGVVQVVLGFDLKRTGTRASQLTRPFTRSTRRVDTVAS